MHRLPGRVRFAPYRDDLAQTAPCQSQTHRSVAKNYSKTHSRWVNQPVDVPANSINRYSPHHAFSIGTAKPTRLPPWEDFQRGPQSAHAEILHPDPHRKSFTKVVNAARCINGSLRSSTLLLTFGNLVLIVRTTVGDIKWTQYYSRLI